MAKYEMNYGEVDYASKKKKAAGSAEDVFEMLETLIFAFFGVILVFTFMLRIANVDGSSMLPTLTSGDKLILTHINYTPSRGDIVVVSSDSLEKYIVKRIIAVGGETIDIDFETGEVAVDGRVLSEDYILDLTKLDEGGHSYPVRVPEGCVFVMGDNRMNSLDSRSDPVGFIDESDILGKVFLRVYPFEAIGFLA